MLCSLITIPSELQHCFPAIKSKYISKSICEPKDNAIFQEQEKIMRQYDEDYPHQEGI